MIRPLLCSASPRDIHDFQEAIAKIPCDKLFAKYHTEREAYRVLRKMFLGAKQYTHMILCPDDLIVTPKDYEILLKDVEEFDYPIIAGTCNLVYGESRYITGKTVSPKLELYTPEELFSGEPIKLCEFDGFAFSFIRRDIVKQIEFHSKRYMSTAFDNAFALDCHERGIPMRVDTRAKMLHLANRLGNGAHENMGFGKKPTLIFERYN
jgi:hypothetical protein